MCCSTESEYAVCEGALVERYYAKDDEYLRIFAKSRQLLVRACELGKVKIGPYVHSKSQIILCARFWIFFNFSVLSLVV